MIYKKTKNYIANSHAKSSGYIARTYTLNNTYFQYHFEFENLLKMNFNEKNTLISLNTFYIPFRKTENLKELNAIWIDHDFYNKSFIKNQIIMNLEDDFYRK